LNRKSGCILGQMLWSDNSPCPAHKGYAAAVAAQQRFLKGTTIGQLADQYGKLGRKGRVL
jgi:hypothetical protein